MIALAVCILLAPPAPPVRVLVGCVLAGRPSVRGDAGPLPGAELLEGASVFRGVEGGVRMRRRMIAEPRAR